MKSMFSPDKLAGLLSLSAVFALPLQAQEWQVVDTFPDGSPEGTWTAIGQPLVDTSAGYLRLKMTSGTNATSTVLVDLPATYSSGKVTIAFDAYFPNGIQAHEAGFGAGSAAMAENTGWGPIGTDNRFQMVGDAPQNLAKVPEWTTDITTGLTGTDTATGVVYNIWLVYDLDADPKTVTTYVKEATEPMETENLAISSFDYTARSDPPADDWSSLSHFGLGIGLLSDPPSGLEATDSLGMIVDNIYVSTGENITLTPTAFDGAWELVDTFTGGAPEGTWIADAGIVAAFPEDSLLVTVTEANAGIAAELPISLVGGSTTLTLDILFPSGGLNNALLAVVGENELAQTGTARFGNNDRFLTFGAASPQALTKWTAWTTDLLGDTQQDTWYHVWFVYDHDALTVDFYSVPFAESGTATPPSEPAGSFDLTTDYAGFSHLILGGWQAGNAGIRVDNIYQTFGQNISLSPTAGDIGGPAAGLTVGEWNLTDIGWVFGYTPEWGYSTFMGFVYMGYLPWIYQVPFGYMALVQATPSGSGTIFWFYSPTMGWVFADDTFGGFFQSENADWAYNNFLNPNG